MARKRASRRKQPKAALPLLPPELLDAITSYLPPSSLHSLSISSRSLASYVSLHGWKSLAHTRFPSIRPPTSDSWLRTARTLCTLSRAWDRRALVARVIEPKEGGITVWPSGKREERWRRPGGQTIGYTPVIGVNETAHGSGRRETLVWSAGAQVVIRKRTWREDVGNGRGEKVEWESYAPVGASEGRDDVTALHLLDRRGKDSEGVDLVLGTAAGQLECVRLPGRAGGEVQRRRFITDGQPVRSSSLLESTTGHNLLAAQLGDSTISLYDFDDSQPDAEANSRIDINTGHTGTSKQQPRAWSVKLLSDRQLAVGTGPSTRPISIYTLLPTGLSTAHVRHFSLVDPFERLAISSSTPKGLNSVYPIIPLPATTTATHPSLFLSGAYDGQVRMHDLRSSQDVVKSYIDPMDDSGIYSLLARGQESVVVGANSQSKLKIFDLRMGSKCYDYLDAQASSIMERRKFDNTLFLRVPSQRKSSAVYSLASASPSSPHLYAGISGNVLELAVTETGDPRPDPVYFKPYHGGKEWNGWKASEVLELAGYEISSDGRNQLMAQSGVLGRPGVAGKGLEGLDERWWDKTSTGYRWSSVRGSMGYPGL